MLKRLPIMHYCPLTAAVKEAERQWDIFMDT
jgi:hypothetical protein